MLRSAAMNCLRRAAGRAVCVVCLSLSFTSSVFAATEEEKSGARAAATQGEKAFEEHRWAEALDLFTRAESLVHSPVHLLYKARSLAQLGQLVKARETYLALDRETLPANASPALLKAQDSAREEAKALEPRLANVTIKVEGASAADVAVTMDGVKVPAALVGLSRPVDPGEHKLQATGNGIQSDVVTVSVKEGGSASATLIVKPTPGAALPAEPTNPANPPAAAAGTPPAGAIPPPTTLPPASTEKTRPVPTGVYVGVAATVAFAAGGAIVGAMASSKHSEFQSHNDGSDAAHATDLKNSGKTLNLVSDALFGGALVAAGITTVLYVTRPEVPAQGASVRLVPVVGPQGAFLGCVGRF